MAEPTVSEINNDVTINGDLTVTGTINGSSGGGGGGEGIVLPPDPESGQVLGWVNGELAWVTPPEVPDDLVGLPTPYGINGSVLTIDDDSPAWIYKSEPPPSNIVWSDYMAFADNDGTWGPGTSVTQVFDGNTNTVAFARVGPEGLVFNPPYNLGGIISLEIWLGMETNDAAVEFQGFEQTLSNWGTWNTCTRFAGLDWDWNTPLTIKSGSGSAGGVKLAAIRLNGEILTDSVSFKVDQLKALEERIKVLENGTG